MDTYIENEITSFVVLDIHAYHDILKRISDQSIQITYQKCLYYNYDEDTVRIVATSSDPIDPVAFESRRGPYKYSYDYKKKIIKSTRHAIPLWVEKIMCFVNASTKSSTEQTLPEDSPLLDMEPDELRGKYRKEFIVDRIILYQNDEKGCIHRASINKKCKFSGNGGFRQPDVPVYILEYEIEYSDVSQYHIRLACDKIIKILRNTLNFSVDDLYNIMCSGQKNCLPESDLFISILSTYKRNFTSRPLPRKISKNSNIYVCKKWDGIRAMGLWKGSGLLLYSGDFGFKYFDVPIIFAPDTIVQVEFFPETETFVVTEIFATTNIEMETDFVYFMRSVGNTCRMGEGLYNGSNTSIQLQDNRKHLTCCIDPLDSVCCLQLLHEKYPSMFTVHYKLNEWPINPLYALKSELFTGNSDGIILKIFNESNKSNPIYYKIKNSHTIELLYMSRNNTFVSMEGTVYNDIIDTNDFNFKYLMNKYMSIKRDITMEFIVYEKRLQFKCVRYDKICPDNDEKIKDLINT